VKNLYRTATAAFAVTFVGVGIALVVVTAVRGGSVTGYVLGVLFAMLGIGRLYLLRGRA
jgi:hypothetical protein